VIVAYSFVPVHDVAAGEEFAAALAGRSRAVERFPRSLRFEFRRESGRAGRYVIVTWWETRRDLARYMANPEHRATHGRLSAAGAAGPEPARVEVHEVLEVSGGG